MFDTRRSLELSALLFLVGCGGAQLPPDGGVDAGPTACPALNGNEVTHG